MTVLDNTVDRPKSWKSRAFRYSVYLKLNGTGVSSSDVFDWCTQTFGNPSNKGRWTTVWATHGRVVVPNGANHTTRTVVFIKGLDDLSMLMLRWGDLIG